jgi:hypothetical protein
VREDAKNDWPRFVGRSLDGLSLSDRWTVAGAWIATELYSPQRLPLRNIEAVGASPAECIEQLRSRGLDPGRFEYALVARPYDT